MARTSLTPAAKAAAAQHYLGRPSPTDPLEPLVDAVQEALVHHITLVTTPSGGTALRVDKLEVTISGGGPKKGAQPLAGLGDALKHVVADALVSTLGATDDRGTQWRVALANRILNIELSRGAAAIEGNAPLATVDEEADPLLKTADVAAQLGMSRPYVSMLCDTGKLGEVTKTEGGHRRVRQSAVAAYKAAQLRAHSGAPTPREAAAAAGMYELSDAAFVKAAQRGPESTPVAKRARPAKS